MTHFDSFPINQVLALGGLLPGANSRPIRPICHMRHEILRITIGAAGLAMAASIWFLNAQAQENKHTAALTTNWIGLVVVGKEDAHDAIAPSPYPQCVPQFQLGLRSDGVVVWRPAAAASIQRR